MSDMERANRLYWESEASVNDIADQLELSKSMLYKLIEPLAADVSCPDCGEMLVYPNRTALDRGLMQCEACGLEDVAEGDLDGGGGGTAKGGRSSRRTLERSGGAGSGHIVDGAYRPHDPVADRQALIGAGLLGAAALLWIYRRA